MPTVRDLAWTDFEGLTALYFTRYEEVDHNPDLGVLLRDPRPTMGEETAWFSGLYRELLEGVSIASVAEEDARIVGMVVVHGNRAAVERAHVGVLGIMVHPDYRDRGIGKALMEHVLARCPGKFTVVDLAVFSINARAKHLYEKFGFRTWGTEPKAIRRGERYIPEDHMSLEIPPPG
jgi:ribosomal protein S18 acetylase RimI-like enzyme